MIWRLFRFFKSISISNLDITKPIPDKYLIHNIDYIFSKFRVFNSKETEEKIKIRTKIKYNLLYFCIIFYIIMHFIWWKKKEVSNFLYIISILSKYWAVYRYIIYNIISKNVCLYVCLFVWPLIGSAHGHDRNMRPVSIELLWPEVETFEKVLPKNDQWPNYRSQMFPP